MCTILSYTCIYVAVTHLTRTMCCPANNTPAVCSNSISTIQFREGGNETTMEIFLLQFFFLFISFCHNNPHNDAIPLARGEHV